MVVDKDNRQIYNVADAPVMSVLIHASLIQSELQVPRFNQI